MKIIEYEAVIVGVRNSYELGEMVNAKIKAGFQPYGHPITAGASGEREGENEADFIIVQAMVKYEG